MNTDKRKVRALGLCSGGLDSSLATIKKLPDYLDFITQTLEEVYRMLAPGGVVAFVVGDVFDRRQKSTLNLAEEIWRNLQYEKSRFQLHTIMEDRIKDNTKVTKIWKEDKKGQATQVDRILVLYKDHIEELCDDVAW